MFLAIVPAWVPGSQQDAHEVSFRFLIERIGVDHNASIYSELGFTLGVNILVDCSILYYSPLVLTDTYFWYV